MSKNKKINIADYKIQIILVVIGLLAFFLIGPLIGKALNPFLERILPLYLVFIVLLTLNWYLVADSGMQISILMRRDFNMLKTLVPILSGIEYITLYADYKEDIEESKPELIVWLPMAATEIAYLIFTGILIYNIAHEGLYYETDEVNLAFHRWIISMLFYNTSRLLIISRITYGLRNKTYIRGVKAPYIINIVGLVLITLLFGVGRVIPTVARGLSLPVVNIFIFILLPIVVPIYVNWKCKSIIKDIKITQTPKERLR